MVDGPIRQKCACTLCAQQCSIPNCALAPFVQVVGVIADRPSLLYDGSTRLRSSHAPLQDNDCFEHGVVVGSALEEVPYALAVRAQYGDNSGMSHMEECCRVEQLQSVAHSLVFGAINNGLMFG